ncbi:hypothetical protein Tco_1005155 [Tanacetum coccineum]|uniref:Retrovirus-related Pol polyprotein from transposon TNT 1-94-like beta-barrel domain-containing protein n=1 Tax=Tanacetum coccineum TaxID=301880 RepID=A0ABQ5FED1_9ASTR
MDQDSAHMVAASKVPMLKPGEFELWRMRIEQYIQMIDYALWEVIENGATLPKIAVVEGVKKVMPITSAEDKAQRSLEVKDRSTLMIGILNEHQLKFNSIKDAKLLLEAVEKRFSGNATTKKTQRNLLNQQYENFTAPSSEMIDQTFDRLQKLMTELETMRMDDLYNNLKGYEPEVKGMSSSSSNTQNMSSSCDGLGGYNWSDQAEEGPKYALMAYSSLSSDSEIVDNCKKGLGYEKYNVVPPPYTGNFMPPTSDLSFTSLDEFVNKPIVENSMSDKEVSKVVRKSDDSLIIEDWVSNSEEENVSQTKTKKKTGNPQMDLQDKGVIDSGCSRHMTGNMSYLTDYEEIDGGYVAFGGNPKGGKIT